MPKTKTKAGTVSRAKKPTAAKGKTAGRPAKKKPAKKAAKKRPSKKQTAKSLPEDEIELPSFPGFSGDKLRYLQARWLDPMAHTKVIRALGLDRSHYRYWVDNDQDFFEAVMQIEDETVQRLKSRALTIGLGQEDEIRFVGKEGRRETVKKDGQVTLRWLLEALEPQTFNQKAIEARRDQNLRDPVVVMPELLEEGDLPEVEEIEEESVQ